LIAAAIYVRFQPEARMGEGALVAGIEDIDPWNDEAELTSILDDIVAALSLYLHMSATDLDTAPLSIRNYPQKRRRRR